ncbi:MAG: host-nuclease inhibitor Gam family protein [bacterium]|nr:host-nuclease inhibitor Gam family protein [bacterium]
MTKTKKQSILTALFFVLSLIHKERYIVANKAIKNPIKKSSGKQSPKITTRENVDEMIARIGILDAQATATTAMLEERINVIKMEAANELETVFQEMLAITKAVIAFVEKHRKELTDDGKRKTVIFPSGEVLFRLSPATLSILDEEALLEILKSRGLTDLIKTTETVIKKALKDHPQLPTLPGVSVSQVEVVRVRPGQGGRELTVREIQKRLKQTV